MPARTNAAGTPACCDVTTPGWRAFTDAPTICPGHVEEGWATYPGGRGVDLDKCRPLACGCLFRVIAGQVVRTCRLHAIGWRACCERATRTACVCAESYDCPIHGNRHCGTHD